MWREKEGRKEEREARREQVGKGEWRKEERKEADNKRELQKKYTKLLNPKTKITI